MATPFKSIQISKNVHWVGAVDWELADFHGYATPRGSTYNAFLILADKVTLIDTVKAPYFDEMMARIESVIDPEKIDYIVSNHSEMDHTGALTETVRRVKPEKVLASAKGVQAIGQHMDIGMPIEAVKEGDTLSLGNMNLHFLMTSMVHWPDSMFSLLDEDKVLFSNDAFGMHLASSERFADEIPEHILHEEAATYYANILWPTSKAVQGVLKKVDGYEGPIEIIAPDHGPVFRKNLDWILSRYRDWATGVADPKKAVIVFDTMWGSTAKMARAIAEGLKQGGMTVKVLPLAKSDRSRVAAELLDASVFLVGSPSLNSGLFPTVADALTYIGGLRPSKPAIRGGVFGSYGWSPAAQKKLVEMLTAMGIDQPEEAVKSQYVPNMDMLTSCHELGEKLAATGKAD